MRFWFALATWIAGLNAVDALNKPHPLASAWFLAGLTVVLLLSTIVLCVVHAVQYGDDDEDVL